MDEAPLFSRNTYSPRQTKAVLFFACPLGTKTSMFLPLIRGLNRDGYVVESYDFSNRVFFKGRPEYLPRLIEDALKDINEVIEDYKKLGYTNFGFLGTSLGAFVLYNAMAAIPELTWGIFNTGGDIAEGMWKFKLIKRAFIKNGQSLESLKKAWLNLQYPSFKERLTTPRFLFIGGKLDPVTPLNKIIDFSKFIQKQTGAEVSVVKVNSIGHNPSAIIGIFQLRKLLKRVNPV